MQNFPHNYGLNMDIITCAYEAQNLLGCTAVLLIECLPNIQDSELHTRRRGNLKSHITCT
jgi:hypothetical protein